MLLVAAAAIAFSGEQPKFDIRVLPLVKCERMPMTKGTAVIPMPTTKSALRDDADARFVRSPWRK